MPFLTHGSISALLLSMMHGNLAVNPIIEAQQRWSAMFQRKCVVEVFTLPVVWLHCVFIIMGVCYAFFFNFFFYTFPFLCTVSWQYARVWDAGAGQIDPAQMLYCSLQTAGGGWALHSVPTDRWHPNREHGREHHGGSILIIQIYIYLNYWSDDDQELNISDDCSQV